MNLVQKLFIGAGLIGSVGVLGCKPNVTGSVDINVDQQNRGTIIGKALINLPYQDPNAGYVGISNANIKFINSTNASVYRTTSSNGGDFLIEIPAGSYNVYGCNRNRDEYWGGKASATVSRGNTVDIGEVRLSWQEAWRCVNF